MAIVKRLWLLACIGAGGYGVLLGLAILLDGEGNPPLALVVFLGSLLAARMLYSLGLWIVKGKLT